MPLLQCKLGHTVQTVRNQSFSFDRDRAGRYVCEVPDTIAPIFLSVEHYQVVKPLDDTPAIPAAAAGAKKKLSAKEQARLDLERKANQTEAERAEAERLAELERIEREAAEAKDKAEREAAEAAEAEAAAEAKRNAGEPAAPVGVTAIKGIGDKMAGKLAEKGITTLEQIATMSDAFKASLDADLNLKNAIDRDGWIDQAKALLAQTEDEAAEGDDGDGAGD